MTQRQSLALVLAAGQGTRMKSDIPKVLHEIAGLPMIAHVMETAQTSGLKDAALVVAPGMDDVETVARVTYPEAGVYVQKQQLGTAHAVLAARQALEDFSGHVIILYGDTPLIRSQTITQVLDVLTNGADLAVLGFEARDPTGYGRLITDSDGGLTAVREEKEASAEERAVKLCNSGVFAFESKYLLGLLDRIGNDNAKGEYYLTDAVELARKDGLKTAIVLCSEQEVMGVNSKVQLAAAEAELQSQLRIEAMEGGADADCARYGFPEQGTQNSGAMWLWSRMWSSDPASQWKMARAYVRFHILKERMLAKLRSSAPMRDCGPVPSLERGFVSAISSS